MKFTRKGNEGSYINNNIGDMALKQMKFFMGPHPDKVLLCVNYNDDLEYIRHTVKVTESLADTEVTGVVPFRFGL